MIFNSYVFKHCLHFYRPQNFVFEIAEQMFWMWKRFYMIQWLNFALKSLYVVMLDPEKPCIWWKYFYRDMILLLSSEGICFLFDARRKWFSIHMYLNIACISTHFRISFFALAHYSSGCGGCGKCFKWFSGYAFPLKACMWLCLIHKSPAVDEDIFIETWFTTFLRGDLLFVWC